MKLLLAMNLSDRSLTNHILPITNLKDVEKITIVRDKTGPSMDKIGYVTPFHNKLLPPLLMVSKKIFQLIHSSLVDRPLLIHSYLLFPHGYLAFIAGKLTGRKIGVSLIAGPVETYVFGGSPLTKYAYCSALPRPNIINKAILSILNKFDIITVTGSYTRDYLISKGIDNSKIYILPHTVDERFQPLNVDKDYDVVFVGRLAAVKHVETLIQATAEVKKTIPSIRVAIVGDGEDRWKLMILAHALNLNNQIDFVGHQANTWEWYNRSKISVLCSEREGFPYAVIESLKCGVPLIVSDCGDVNDLVKDSFNGIIISKYDDYVAYADAIVSVLKDLDFLKNISANCIKTSGYSNPTSVEQLWEGILRDLSAIDEQ